MKNRGQGQTEIEQVKYYLHYSSSLRKVLFPCEEAHKQNFELRANESQMPECWHAQQNHATVVQGIAQVLLPYRDRDNTMSIHSVIMTFMWQSVYHR